MCPKYQIYNVHGSKRQFSCLESGSFISYQKLSTEAFFFSFHSNLTIKHKVVQKFPKFHQEILTRWGKFLSSPLKVSSAIASQFIWYDEYIKIDNNTIYNRHLSKKKT